MRRSRRWRNGPSNQGGDRSRVSMLWITTAALGFCFHEVPFILVCHVEMPGFFRCSHSPGVVAIDKDGTGRLKADSALGLPRFIADQGGANRRTASELAPLRLLSGGVLIISTGRGWMASMSMRRWWRCKMLEGMKSEGASCEDSGVQRLCIFLKRPEGEQRGIDSTILEMEKALTAIR